MSHNNKHQQDGAGSQRRHQGGQGSQVGQGADQRQSSDAGSQDSIVQTDGGTSGGQDWNLDQYSRSGQDQSGSGLGNG